MCAGRAGRGPGTGTSVAGSGHATERLSGWTGKACATHGQCGPRVYFDDITEPRPDLRLRVCSPGENGLRGEANRAARTDDGGGRDGRSRVGTASPRGATWRLRRLSQTGRGKGRKKSKASVEFLARMAFGKG